MVLEAVDEVICISETVYNTGSGGSTPHQRGGRPDTSAPCGRANQDTYLVLDDLGGNFGRVWRETAEADANHETLIRDLLDDQYSRPSAHRRLQYD